MTTDLYLLGADLRARWRPLVLLSVLVAVVVATILATLAGARRTETAFDRYLERTRPADLVATPWDPTATMPDLADIPGVEAAVGFHWYAVFPGDPGREFIPLLVPDDDRIPNELHRLPVIEGRAPDPDAALEIALGERLARRLGVGVGDQLPAAAFTAEEVADEFSGADPEAATRLDFEVVGIVRGPGDIASRADDIELTMLTPAFAEDHRDDVGLFTLGTLLRAKPGYPVDAIEAAIQERYPEAGMEVDTFIGSEVVQSQAAPTLRAMATGLRLVAGVVALVGGTSIVLSLVRGASDRMAEQRILSALGTDRGGLLRQLGLASAAACLLGVVIGVIGALVLSPLAVWGMAARADVGSGPAVDWLILGVGGALAAMLLLVSVVAVAVVARRREGIDRSETSRPSAVATRAASAGAPVTVVAGLRLAFERGHGSRTTPVAAAATAAALGGLGVVAALVFSSSLEHAVESPEVWGYDFDAILDRMEDGEGSERASDPLIPAILSDPSFTRVAEYVVQLDVTLDGVPQEAVALEDLTGHTPFVISRGREPLGIDEVALGASLLADRDLAIGDTISLERGGHELDATIVGVAVLPVTDDGGLSSTGVALRRDTADALGFDGTCDDDESCVRGLALSVAPGVDPAAATARYTADETLLYLPPTAPSEVARLTVVDRLPRVLAVFLALISIVTLTHAASATVRRRRRELAVLRVLGFTTRDLRSTARVQVAALSLVGGVLGVVLGVAVGRQLWTSVARSVSLPVIATMPVLVVGLVPLGILLLALLAATLSRRAAGRIPAALALRAE